MTLMKAKKPLALLLALLAALSLLGTTALAAGLPEETIAAQTELCGEDCGHTHEEVFSHTEHTEESLPEPEEIAVPVATPLLEQPEPEAGQPSDTSGVIPGSGIYWELNEYGWLMLSGNGSCPTFVSPDDQPWAAVREQITQVWFEDMDALSIPSLAYWFTGCTALTMAEIPYTTPVIRAAAFAASSGVRTRSPARSSSAIRSAGAPVSRAVRRRRSSAAEGSGARFPAYTTQRAWPFRTTGYAASNSLQTQYPEKGFFSVRAFRLARSLQRMQKR